MLDQRVCYKQIGRTRIFLTFEMESKLAARRLSVHRNLSTTFFSILITFHDAYRAWTPYEQMRNMPSTRPSDSEDDRYVVSASTPHPTISFS